MLLGEVGGLLSSEQTVLSVAAAMPTAQIEKHLSDGVPVLRAMPNAPATVHEGVAGLCAGAHANGEHLAMAQEVLTHVGRVVQVPEPYMDAVTAVSGSGPAYFALLAEAMIEAGILLGLSREVSTELVVQTMFGTAKLLRDEHMHPVELREMVTSPGGTTIRAIRELERAGVRAAFLNAIQAAMERSQELAKGRCLGLKFSWEVLDRSTSDGRRGPARRGGTASERFWSIQGLRAATSELRRPSSWSRRHARASSPILSGGSAPEARLRAGRRARAGLERRAPGGATSAACRPTTSARTTSS